MCDIALLVEKYPHLDWAQVVTQAKAAGAQRILLIGLSLASNLLEARVPAAVPKSLDQNKRSSNLIRNLTERIFSSDTREPVTLNDQFQTLHLKMRERFADQFRYCLRVAFTPGTGEWGLISLPPSLYFLYYLLRPFRLVGKIIKRTGLTRTYG